MIRTNQDDTIFLFLDDVREPPSDEWIIVRNTNVAYTLIRNIFSPIVLSLDHDMGENIPTGYDLLNWIERDIAMDETFRPMISFQIHSANPVGRDNMARAIGAIEKMMR